MSMSLLDGRKAEQWFRRRGLPSVVRGLEDNLTVRIVPAVVWLALSELLYEVLIAIDGDAAFPSKLENTLFQLLYTTTLVGSVVLPWLAVIMANDRPAKRQRYTPPAVPQPARPALPAPRDDRAIDA